jgi:hypothetical protein
VLHRRAFLTDFGSFITGSFNEVGKVVFQRFFIAGVVKVFKDLDYDAGVAGVVEVDFLVVGDLADLAVWMLVDVFICAFHSQKIGRCTKRRVFVMRYLKCDVVKPRDVGAAKEKNLRCVGEVGREVEGNCAAVEGGVCVRHFGCRVYSVARNA